MVINSNSLTFDQVRDSLQRLLDTDPADVTREDLRNVVWGVRLVQAFSPQQTQELSRGVSEVHISIFGGLLHQNQELGGEGAALAGFKLVEFRRAAGPVNVRRPASKCPNCGADLSGRDGGENSLPAVRVPAQVCG